MLANNNPYQSYRQIQIETATPIELVIKLYDGAIRFINIAKKNIEENNYQQVNASLKKAEDIIEELNVSLNMDAGEISQNLRSIYNFINNELVEANISKEKKKLDEVTQILITLRSAWVEIQGPKKQAVSE